MSVRLMLVDDSAQVRLGLRMMLATRPGFVVVGEAGDGATAVHLSQALRPDVILMDVELPVMNGLDATKHILAARPGTRVVILTMNPTVTTRALAAAAGASGCLAKVDASDDLWSAIMPGGCA